MDRPLLLCHTTGSRGRGPAEDGAAWPLGLF